MYPTIYHALLDLTGIDLPFLKMMNSFGFFVALAFMSAAYFLKLALERKTKDGSIPISYKKVIYGKAPSFGAIINSAIFGFVIGYKFVYLARNVDIAMKDPQGFMLSTEGYLASGILGALVFLGITYNDYRKEKKQYPEPISKEIAITSKEHSWNMAVYAAIFGFTGAKLFHLFENPDQMIAFFSDFDFAQLMSGLTIYGGLILGGAGVMWYMNKHNIPLLAGSDAVVPGLMLAYGIGRIGCQVSGDGDWGINNLAAKPGWMSWLPDWTWAYTYPNNVNRVGTTIIDGTCFEGYCTELPYPVFPTPFYETMMAIGLFFILWKLSKSIKIPGVLFFIYMIFNGFERFWIEKIRINNDFLTIGGWTMTQAELISMLMFVAGITGIIVLQKRYRRNNIA